MLAPSRSADAQQTAAFQRALQAEAVRGSAAAQYSLGAEAEESGDLFGAVAWYRQAAEHGDAAAQFKLGELLEKGGGGIDPNAAYALEWYRKAAAQEFPAAMVRLELLAPRSNGPQRLSVVLMVVAGLFGGSLCYLILSRRRTIPASAKIKNDPA